MANYSESPLDRLWREYSVVFEDCDDLTLGRWMAQTLTQLEGRAWRLSHPLVGAYRLASHLAHERQIWLKRIAPVPAAYREAACCRAPLLPLLTRDVTETGLVCQHCGESCVPWEEIPAELHDELKRWADEYAPWHEVAHWDDEKRRRSGGYDDKLEEAAEEVERLLGRAGSKLAPRLLDWYPAIIWEDQDECLEVRPEDVRL
ncbi:MAG TPA: hypothetical protein VNO52_08515 [Methylomirabilota bacterium]|nr:hypothetical protein [Methylomirabilota bacterium]